MTQNELKAKLELLRSLASAAAKLEMEIKEDLPNQKLAALAIRDVRYGENNNIGVAMESLEDAGVLSCLPKGEPVASPFVDLERAYYINIGVQYPSGDKLIATLGSADYETYQTVLNYDAIDSKGDNVLYGLALAEIKKGKLAECHDLPEDNKDVDVYLWENIEHDDFTRKFTISHDELVGLLETDREREE